MIKIIPLVFIALFCVNTHGVELLKAMHSWDGGAYQYPEGRAEITSFKLTLEEGKATPHHCHPVPTMGYILHGEIEVTTSAGKKQVFKAGQSVVEVMGTIHQGRALKGPVEIIVFYAGESGTPNTVLEGDKDYAKHCK